MKNQVLELLQYYNMTHTQLAEKIDIQPSRISHILSGRNNPSYDFIYRLLQAYPALNAEWLLTGKGSMLKSESKIEKSVTENNPDKYSKPTRPKTKADLFYSVPQETYKSAKQQTDETQSASDSEKKSTPSANKSIEKIVIFYSDKTFTEYSPGD